MARKCLIDSISLNSCPRSRQERKHRRYENVCACKAIVFLLFTEPNVETVVQLLNIAAKPDITLDLEVDVDEFYEKVGEDKRHFREQRERNKKMW